MSESLLFYLCFLVGQLVLIAFLLLIFHDRGFRKGSKEGYERGFAEGVFQGRMAADNWWIRSESEAETERQKMWREEAS